MFRKIVVGLLTAAILLMAVFLAGRCGWKALGFRFSAVLGTSGSSLLATQAAVEPVEAIMGAAGLR